MAARAGYTGLIALVLLGGLYCMVAFLNDSLLGEVNAQESLEFQVAITGQRPSISNVKCCWKDSDVGSYDLGDCATDESTPYSITGGEPYDMMCNFTVTDSNGWQDMTNGWTNVTWFNAAAGASWSSANDNDNHYVNASCKNVTGTETGNTIIFECLVAGLKYWADAGNWTLLVNSSDGTDVGTPKTTSFRLSNKTSIWQTSVIDFGTMDLSAAGSSPPSSGSGNADVNAITNNTGNSRVRIELAGGGDMSCTISTIAVGSIEYDVTDDTSMATACGQLTAAQAWDAGCTAFNLNDCTDTCAALPLDYTYWGITIPSSGVGGACSLTITVYGEQAP